MGSMSTLTTYIMNVPPGFVRLNVSAFKDGNSDGAVNVKIRPYVDHDQTIVNGALYAYRLGSSTVTTSMDIASSNTAAGHIWEVVPDAGSTGSKGGGSSVIHNHAGFQITIDVNTNATTSAGVGNLTVDVHAQTP